MKIVAVGTGFVGLTHAALCSECGHAVHAYDVDTVRLNACRSGKADQIARYVNEPGLVVLVREHLERSLFFIDDLVAAVEGASAIFLCLPTPPRHQGSSDLSYYFAAVRDLCDILKRRRDQRAVVLINKSTVPVGTARRLDAVVREYGVRNSSIASNPEFLPEGDAAEDARHPDRVVVGADTAADFSILQRLYSQFVGHVRIRYIETTPETAEASKADMTRHGYGYLAVGSPFIAPN